MPSGQKAPRVLGVTSPSLLGLRKVLAPSFSSFQHLSFFLSGSSFLVLPLSESRDERTHSREGVVSVEVLICKVGSETLIVAGDEVVSVVHAGSVNSEPVNHSNVLSFLVLKSKNGDDLICVSIWVFSSLALGIGHVSSRRTTKEEGK